MISSTFRDLEEYRKEVMTGCARVGFNDQHRMENLGALNAGAVQASLAMVEKADIYLCFLAHRYGYEPPGCDISITEMEYNKAVELEKPRLAFFIVESHPFPADRVDKGAAHDKLVAFKKRVAKDRVGDFFTTPDNLRSKVVEALTNLKEALMVDAGEEPVHAAQRALHRRSTIPKPPDPYIAHPYTLMQSRRLVGRQKELGVLTDWISDRTNLTRMFNLVAIGGMGKSALAWQFFQKVAPNERPDLAGRIWWSFYERDATFKNFMVHTLAYLTGVSEAGLAKRTWAELESGLLSALAEGPVLIVLDGLERILQAYHRMDAAHLTDDEALDERTANRVAGAYGLPETAAQSFIGKHRLRQMTDPRAGVFLRKLLQNPVVRTLVTTRLYPTDLQAQTGRPLPHCLAYFQRGLSDEDGLELWRELGIRGKSADLKSIFQSVEGHPLLIHSLAAEVANYRPEPGDFSQWRAAHPGFDPTTLPLAKARSHILAHALHGLDEAQRAALEHIAAFRMPASYDTLEALLVGEEMPCANPGELDTVLTDLEDRGLIGWDKDANRYDIHPIVRGVVWSLTGDSDKHAVLNALDAHFEPMEVPDVDDVDSLADLAPAIERYNSLIGLDRFDEAFDLFRDRLDDASFYRIAAHRERIEWLENLFPDSPLALPRLVNVSDQVFCINALAMSYLLSGKPRLAAPIYRAGTVLAEQQSGILDQSVFLSNLGICLNRIGALRETDHTLRRSLGLARDAEDAFEVSTRLRELGRFFTVIGRIQYSERALSRSITSFKLQYQPQSQCVSSAYEAESALFQREFPAALERAKAAWELALQRRFAIDLIRALLHLGQARLGLGDIYQADTDLHAALTQTRAVNVVEFELPALVAIAQLSFAKGEIHAARAHLEDVWEAAEQGPFPLHHADALNTLADIERAEGNAQAAINAATQAYRTAWCDGPPYAYHWGLEAAKAHLDALSAPYPDMPPFDENAHEPLPDVELFPDEEVGL